MEDRLYTFGEAITFLTKEQAQNKIGVVGTKTVREVVISLIKGGKIKGYVFEGENNSYGKPRKRRWVKVNGKSFAKFFSI